MLLHHLRHTRFCLLVTSGLIAYSHHPGIGGISRINQTSYFRSRRSVMNIFRHSDNRHRMSVEHHFFTHRILQFQSGDRCFRQNNTVGIHTVFKLQFTSFKNRDLIRSKIAGTSAPFIDGNGFLIRLVRPPQTLSAATAERMSLSHRQIHNFRILQQIGTDSFIRMDITPHIHGQYVVRIESQRHVLHIVQLAPYHKERRYAENNHRKLDDHRSRRQFILSCHRFPKQFHRSKTGKIISRVTARNQ